MAYDETTFPEMTGFFQAVSECHSIAVIYHCIESIFALSRYAKKRR